MAAAAPQNPYPHNASRYFLRLRGVQYTANVHAFGKHLGDMEGMFKRGEFELPSLAAAQGYANGTAPELAVRVAPPTFIGPNTTGQGGSLHQGARTGPTTQFAAGWDWIRYTPDRHTGLWDIVTVDRTGPAAIVGDVNVDSAVTGFDADLVHGAVAVNVSVTASFPEGASAADYALQASITDADGTLIDAVGNGTVSVASVDARTTTWTWTVSAPRAQLWWPFAYGSPHLYKLDVRVVAKADPKAVSDARSVAVGFRNIAFVTDGGLGGPVAVVNGHKVFLTGGNWIVMDQFLRGTADEAEYRKHVHMHKAMGLDVIRVWGGGIAERAEFYKVCDEEGVMVWQEFWMTGDNNGRWGGNHTWPEDHSVYMDNAKDVVAMLKHHASLAFWCLGNELDGMEGKAHGVDGALLDRLTEFVHAYDPHGFLWRSSMGGDPTDWDPALFASPKDGNYAVLSEEEAWTRNPGMYGFINQTLTRLDHIPLPFNPEQGASAVPVYASMTQFLSQRCADGTDLCLNGFPKNKSDAPEEKKPAVSTVSPVWNWHKYEGWNDDAGEHWIYDRYNLVYRPAGAAAPAAGEAATGSVTSAEDFADYAQLAQYDQYRVLFEGHLGKMFTWYSGVFHWKSQSPWPAFRGFFYDNWFRQTGGYFGVKAALRRGTLEDSSATAPNSIHAVRKPVNATVNGTVVQAHAVTVTNRNLTPSIIPMLCVKAFDRAGAEVKAGACVYNVSVGGMAVKEDVFPAPHVDSADTAVVRLVVSFDGHAQELPSPPETIVNEYLTENYRVDGLWRAREAPARPTLVVQPISRSPSAFSIDVTHVGDVAAVVSGVYVSLYDDADAATHHPRRPILPAFCDVGYFNLMPRESRVVTCEHSGNENVVAVAHAFNAGTAEVTFT
eukprot:TRINITY_DN10816_c0_g1_i1.p1 TRINITY_DN10816_c0_g1~~TRINITY_DN10816_c0_g1_i1.p1  ORF type:complete len:1001 (+),score=359.81 TRINITY_DN10816_c0_g1_i1:333-3005(+)